MSYEKKVLAESLDASARIAEGAEKIMYANPKMSYDEAVEQYISANPGVSAAFAGADGDGEKTYARESLNAAQELEKLVFEYQKKGFDYEKAVDLVWQDPENADLVKQYAAD